MREGKPMIARKALRMLFGTIYNHDCNTYENPFIKIAEHFLEMSFVAMQLEMAGRCKYQHSHKTHMSPPSPLKLFPGGHVQAQHNARQKKATDFWHRVTPCLPSSLIILILGSRRSSQMCVFYMASTPSRGPSRRG